MIEALRQAQALLRYANQVAKATAHIEPPKGVSLRLTSAASLVFGNADVVHVANNILQSNQITLHAKDNNRTT